MRRGVYGPAMRVHVRRLCVAAALATFVLAPATADAMNKKEMASKLAEAPGVSTAQALDVINIIFGTKGGSGIIATELDAGRSVSIPGFGTFGNKPSSAKQTTFETAPLLAHRTDGKPTKADVEALDPKAAGLLSPGLRKQVAKKTGLSVKQVDAVVLAIFDARPGKGIIATELAKGGTVQIPGFGTFGTKSIRTGDTLHATVVFTPDKALRKRPGR